MKNEILKIKKIVLFFLYILGSSFDFNFYQLLPFNIDTEISKVDDIMRTSMSNCFWVLETCLKIDRYVKEKIIRFSIVYFLKKSTSQMQSDFRFRGVSLEKLKNEKWKMVALKYPKSSMATGAGYSVPQKIKRTVKTHPKNKMKPRSQNR